MSEMLWLALALAGGVALGVVYFGGLWLTVREMQATSMSGLLPVGSFVGRAAVALLGFYILAGGQLTRLLAAFLGFLLARTVLVRRWRN